MENTATQKQPAFNRKDIYQIVTDTIIQQLEAGTVPWQKPWTGDDNRLLPLPENFTTGNKYQGINIVLLWGSSLQNGYASNEWATFKQWSEKKECIRKDEKGSLIVYYDTMEKEVDGEIEKIPFLKSSYVFNRCQLKSYDATQIKPKTNTKSFVEKIDAVENFVANTKAIIEHGEGGAYYRPLDDKIVMPLPESFVTTASCTATEGYYSTMMHELTHWSGSANRLNRTKGKRFGDNEYAYEELVAELGASFLCADFGLSILEKGDHANYIANWLKVLKDNKDFIVSAASEASKAVGYLKNSHQL